MCNIWHQLLTLVLVTHMYMICVHVHVVAKFCWTSEILFFCRRSRVCRRARQRTRRHRAAAGARRKRLASWRHATCRRPRKRGCLAVAVLAAALVVANSNQWKPLIGYSTVRASSIDASCLRVVIHANCRSIDSCGCIVMQNSTSGYVRLVV